MIVTFAHYLTIPSRKGHGYCRGKGSEWFERYGLDWRDFVANGIEEEKLLATRNAMGRRLVMWAHECAKQEAALG